GTWRASGSPRAVIHLRTAQRRQDQHRNRIGSPIALVSLPVVRRWSTRGGMARVAKLATRAARVRLASVMALLRVAEIVIGVAQAVDGSRSVSFQRVCNP